MTETTNHLNEQVLEYGRKTGESLLDVYETTATSVADYQDKLADTSSIDWLKSVGHAQASFTRDISKVYVGTARELLK
jgi:hypothetical protein